MLNVKSTIIFCYRLVYSVVSLIIIILELLLIVQLLEFRVLFLWFLIIFGWMLITGTHLSVWQSSIVTITNINTLHLWLRPSG